VIVYAVSLQFVVRSIESWFDVRVDSALEGGIALGQNALDYLVSQVSEKAADMAIELEGVDPVSPTLLNRIRERVAVSSATVIGANGQVVATVSDGIASLMPDLPTMTQLRQARQAQRYQVVDSRPGDGLMIRVVVPIPSRALSFDSRYLQLTQSVPETFARHADAVQEAYRDYQQLTLGRKGLNRIYSLTLTLTLLLALLAAVAVAFVLSRRLVAPLLILAEGTQAVAQGDFSQRQALPARDELGVLTQSFNRMTRQLEEARGSAERNRAAVEAARAYLESVLANLSTGVLAFAADGTLRAANPGALAILDDELVGFEDLSLDQWPRHREFRDALLKGFAEHEGDWHEQVELSGADGGTQTLLIHGARLPEVSAGGLVVVFDDISRLIAAQRTAAWAEVARRLAHEIKNPLTPIQLSAERLRRRYLGTLQGEDAEVLDRATHTIVQQVETMKEMVNAFTEYARAPQMRPERLDLNRLVREVLDLYRGMATGVTLEFHGATGRVLVEADAGRLRQVLHNLIKNALEACAHVEAPQVRVTTLRVQQQDVSYVDLVVEDNGPGFSSEVMEHLFEPYVTTKTRGTGLGLAIVKKIVEEHGGVIQAEDSATGGARLRIRLQAAARAKGDIGLGVVGS
jgi:nitrogen fixation/metabolism regulation signal transduction histidine kinase